MELLIDILKFAGALVAAWVGLALVAGIVEGLISLGAAIASRSRGPEPVAEPSEWPPGDFTLSLLVRLDEGEGVFHPVVQVRGGGRRRSGRIRLELVDPGGAVRLSLKRAFPADALNADLRLPSFAPPDGASPDEVLAWRWDVVLTGATGERRWREHPSAAGGLNHEAELRCGTAPAPVEPVAERLAQGRLKLNEQRALRWLALEVEAGHADDLDLDELAVRVLGSEAGPSPIRQLHEVLAGAPDEPTRLAAGRMIYAPSTHHESLLAAGRPAVSGALARGLRSARPRARAACLWAVRKLGGGGAHGLIAGALPDGDQSARFERVRVLGFIGDRGATPALVDALAREPSAKIRSAILWALGTLADPAALRPCIEALEDRDAETRGYAAWALGKLHDPAALGAVCEARSDPDPAVRRWVERAVGILESASPHEVRSDGT